MYFFLGPTPEKTTQQFTEAIGRHSTPAYWNLGFHLCRWGYDTLANMTAAYQRTLDAGIPLDVQWADIDAMDRRLDFTYDPVNFAGLPEFIEDTLHANGRTGLSDFLITNFEGFGFTSRTAFCDHFRPWCAYRRASWILPAF